MNTIKNFIYFLNHTGNNIPETPIKKIDFYHLTFILEGSFDYYVDKKTYHLEKNDAILLPPDTLRQRSAITNNVKYVIFNYYPTKENEFHSTLFFKDVINNSIKNLVEACPCKIYTLDNINSDNSTENKKTYTLLKNIFNCILIELFDSIKTETHNPHINKALAYINENVTLPITLDSVCKEIHLSKAYTTRLFKKEMNMTVSEYINRQKLFNAKNFLANDEISLREVSSQLGFENYCYFSKIFKNHFGISPLKMKKELQKKH